MRKKNVTVSLFLGLVTFQSGLSISIAATEMNWKGDLRYRQAYDRLEGDVRPDYRHRLRARFGFEVPVNENASLEFRLATGGGKINSTNQTLTDGGDKKPIDLDKAFAKISTTDNSQIWLGKMTNPVHSLAKNELLWDADVTPEGGSFVYDSSGETFKLKGQISGFWIEDGSGGASDVGVLSTQALLVNSIDTEQSLSLLVGYHNYSPVKNRDLAGGGGTGSNAVAGVYPYDFHLAQFSVSYAIVMAGLNLEAYFDFVSNQDSDDNAFIVGLVSGKLKEDSDFSLGYSFRRVESQSIMSIFTDSDFNDGKADAEGHQIKAGYQIKKGISAYLNYSLAERGGLDDARLAKSHHSGQLDVVFNF